MKPEYLRRRLERRRQPQFRNDLAATPGILPDMQHLDGLMRGAVVHSEV